MNETHRLRYTRHDGSDHPYRLTLISDTGNKIAGARFRNRPKVLAVRTWLESKGYEAYGDLKRLSDGSFVSMARPLPPIGGSR